MPRPACATPNEGFIALLAVLIVSAIALTITVSLLLLGTSATQTSFALEQSNQAKALANACAEDALQHLVDNLDYSGGDSLSLGQGGCEIVDVAGSGNNDREVQAEGIVGSVVRRVVVEVGVVNPDVEISRWQEVAEF